MVTRNSTGWEETASRSRMEGPGVGMFTPRDTMRYGNSSVGRLVVRVTFILKQMIVLSLLFLVDRH